MYRLAVILAAFVCTSAWAPAVWVVENQVSYIFASPHTTSHLSSGDAERNLESFDELNAISVADRIVCSFSHQAGILSTLGIFNGETETSLVVEARLTRAQIDYTASLLGEYER